MICDELRSRQAVLNYTKQLLEAAIQVDQFTMNGHKNQLQECNQLLEDIARQLAENMCDSVNNSSENDSSGMQP